VTRPLTGSSLDRALSCPASAVLPQESGPESSYAKHGTDVHAQLENRDEELKERLRDEGYEMDELWPEGGVHEAIVWYDPLSQEAGWEKKPQGTHRDYSKFPDHVIVGTIDYLNPTLGMVDDLKTGWNAPPATTLQLGLASVAMSKQSGVKKLTQSITNLRKGQGPTRKEVNHAEEQLLGTQKTLDRLYGAHLLNRARVAAGHEPDYNPSKANCKYCAAKKACGKAV
jgi:hypothetical protein